ncbi:hypothetical protein AVEN_168543-1 [Araneus ventricosus]|uniref:HTH psq-type domain-containing protein n=1 Tax=Araneus ventricosus TaxID=182803 RepID=A0A4Y2FQY6_ARAVE|nr:hypothetical protein AVEN_168543-1 [Araneus ventricosus]
MANVGKRKAFSIGAEKHGVNAFSQNEIEHFECCDDDVIISGDKMPTAYIRKGSFTRREWTENNLKNAIKAVEEKNMGVNKAAKTFSSPKTTLKRRIKIHNFTKSSLGFASILGCENENKILAHINKLQNRCFTPCRDSVKSMAYQLAEKLKISQTFIKEAKRAGYDWIQSFLNSQ